MKPEDIKLHKREGFTAGGVQLREDGEKSNIIEGVAIVTNKETVLWEGSDYREIEIIDPSCLNAEFLREQDIKLNLLHERRDSIARTPNSLRIDAREDGLHFEADIPDCDLGQRARALIDNGTYTGCSFEFWAKDYSVSERTAADGKKEYVVRHTAFEKITALTIAMDPAYEQTSVGTREAGNEIDKAIDRQVEKQNEQQREVEDPIKDEEAEREERELEEQAERARVMMMQRLRWQRRHNEEYFK